MDIGARILLALGLGAMLLTGAGCSKTRAGVASAATREMAFKEAVAAHRVEVASLDDLHQERYDLIAEYRNDLEGLVQENQKWFDAERSEVEAARQRSEQEYREKQAAFLYRQEQHRHQSLMKQDAITATYIPRVKEVNDRIDAQVKRVTATQVSLQEVKRRR
jgi:hypothetical protein